MKKYFCSTTVNLEMLPAVHGQIFRQDIPVFPAIFFFDVIQEFRVVRDRVFAETTAVAMETHIIRVSYK